MDGNEETNMEVNNMNVMVMQGRQGLDGLRFKYVSEHPNEELAQKFIQGMMQEYACPPYENIFLVVTPHFVASIEEKTECTLKIADSPSKIKDILGGKKSDDDLSLPPEENKKKVNK